MNMPSSSSLYSSQAIAPSIYASMPSAPVSAAPRAAAPKDEIPSLQEGFSTVGLMLWPGKGGELLVTGFMEGHSAENCGLETGDIIIRVDDTAVEGMAASTAAECMAGPTGSSVTVTTSRSTKTTNADGSASTTKTTHSAVITRDVSSDEANKKTNESFKSVIRVYRTRHFPTCLAFLPGSLPPHCGCACFCRKNTGCVFQHTHSGWCTRTSTATSTSLSNEMYKSIAGIC